MGTDLLNSQFIWILFHIRRRAARSLFNPLAQNRFDLLHKTVSAGELVTLHRLAEETPFALRNGSAKKLSVLNVPRGLHGQVYRQPRRMGLNGILQISGIH